MWSIVFDDALINGDFARVLHQQLGLVVELVKEQADFPEPVSKYCIVKYRAPGL